MNMDTNNITRLAPVTGLIAGRITNNGTVAIAGLSGPEGIDRAQVAAVRTAAGIVTLTIKNFQGPQLLAFATATACADNIYMSQSAAPSYSSGTLTVVFVANAVSVDTDTDFDFMIVAC